eukprot:TRINITY_DN1913_c0_g1_i1.p1 TRINITY_DN1913_c0_g1~~TRINITY_DN1913_c0_g1_i1.p1  ORF type:complete len:760 (-),score=127.69 TRINITY_DN1913_c0_g1_i1:128-2356(-)
MKFALFLLSFLTFCLLSTCVLSITLSNSTVAKVELPLSEFLELANETRCSKPSPAIPSRHQLSLASVDITQKKIDFDTLSIELVADFKIESSGLDGEWKTVPLISKNHIISGYSIKHPSQDVTNGRSSIVIEESNYCLLTNFNSRIDVRLDLVVPLEFDPETLRYTFELHEMRSSLKNRMNLSFPLRNEKDAIDIDVKPKPISLLKNTQKIHSGKEQDDESFAQISFYFNTSPLKVSFERILKMQVVDAESHSFRSQQFVHHDIRPEGILISSALFEYNVQKGDKDLVILFEHGTKIIDVESIYLNKWEVRPIVPGDEGCKVGQSIEGVDPSKKFCLLHVSFERKMESFHTVLIQAETEIRDVSDTSVPLFVTRDAKREAFYAAISSDANLEVHENKAESLIKIDSLELPYQYQDHVYQTLGGSSSLLFAYRGVSPKVSLSFSVVSHKEIPVLVAYIDKAVLRSSFVEDKVVSQFVLNLRCTQKQFVSVQFPSSGIQVWSVFVDGQAVKPSESDKSGILIPLKKSSGERLYVVEVSYVQDSQDFSNYSSTFGGSFSLEVPKVDVPIGVLEVEAYCPQKAFANFRGDLKLSKRGVEYTNYANQQTFERSSRKVSRKAMERSAILEEMEVGGAVESDHFSRPSLMDSAQVHTKGVFPVRVGFVTLEDSETFVFTKNLVVSPFEKQGSKFLKIEADWRDNQGLRLGPSDFYYGQEAFILLCALLLVVSVLIYRCCFSRAKVRVVL